MACKAGSRGASRKRRLRRRLLVPGGVTRALSAAALLGGTLVLALSPTAASAALPPPTTFVFTGGEQTYQVPASVVVVSVHATGGFGGPAFNQGGGQGEDLTAYLPVTPNENLYTE